MNIENKKLKNKLINYKKNKMTVVGYGAPARVSTITNFADIDSNLIQFIIDDSKLKQHRYTPGKNIKIFPFKNSILSKVDIIIVFAYEYFNDIKDKIKKKNIVFFKPIQFKKL